MIENIVNNEERDIENNDANAMPDKPEIGPIRNKDYISDKDQETVLVEEEIFYDKIKDDVEDEDPSFDFNDPDQDDTNDTDTEDLVIQ